MLEIRPHPGKQEAFLADGSDITIYGGGAGGGKTWALLLDMSRWAATVKGFTGVIFRRTYPQIMNPGALWDEASSLLPHMGGVPSRSESKWVWPKTGSWIKFSHLQREDDVHSWQGAQLAAFAFDEMTHFSSGQFFYLMSRLRSRCGVRPYFRGTCNPDPTSWVAEFLSGWLDQDGYPLEPSPGVRHMARIGGKIQWSEKAEDLIALGAKPRSVNFIPALLSDNPTLIRDNPDYQANLESLTSVDRARLLSGNWKIRAGGGSFFKRQWISQYLDARPTDVLRWMRYWDRAATEQSETSPDPDWTAGALLGVRPNGTIVLADVARMRGTPGSVRAFIRSTAESDGRQVEQVLEQDPGQAGIVDIEELVKALAGFKVSWNRVTENKADRAKPLSSQIEAGNLALVRGVWIEAFLAEAEAFLDEREVKAPPGYHDDQVDAAGGAYNFLNVAPEPRVRTI